MMYDVTAIQLLVFCRLASQSGRFDKFNRQKCNLTPRLQQEDRAAPFYPSKIQNRLHAVLLGLVLKIPRVRRRVSRVCRFERV
jgi:hypothetical protein